MLLSELLRDIEVDAGTSDMALLVFDALKDAIQTLKVEDNETFYDEFKQLVEVVSRTEPKYAILNYYVSQLLSEFCALKEEDGVDYKQWAIDHVSRIHDEMQLRTEAILEHSDKIRFEGKTILLHDHSHTVHKVLQYQKKKGKKFKVIVAEQEHEKTHENIEVLHAAKIPFQVVPDYMISHIHKNVDMVFFGGLTVKDTMDVVMDPGAYAVISQFKAMNIPTYLFIKATKFSFWKSKPRGEIYFHKHKRKHSSKPILYDRLKYSHDRVPAQLFHRIITNDGVLTASKLEELFQKKMEEYKKNGTCS